MEYHFVSKQAFEAGVHHNRCAGWTGRLALGAGVGLCLCPVFPLDLQEGGFRKGGEEEGERILVEVHPWFCATLGKLGTKGLSPFVF